MARQQKQKHKTPHATMLFGLHTVQEAWLNPARTIHALYLTDKMHANMEDALQKAAAQDIKRPKPQIIDKKSLDKKLKGRVHQGIAIEAEPLPEVFVQDMVIKTRNTPKATIVVLDKVTDPHNVGAIIRSASAFGAAGIVMQRRYAPELEGVLAKVASGAIEHIPVAYEINLGRAIGALQSGGFKAIGLDEHATKNIGDDTPGKTALVLGAEGKGLRPSIRDQCDDLVRLPTQGAIQSLNVSNAAAVALYSMTTP